MSVTVSEKPWSDYSASDYSPEQWHSACLIHQHEGAPTSKGQCKLPVRTPDGTLNRGGVKAAAAALAGARGGVDASSEEKSDAASALVKLYRHLDEDPPESLQHAMSEEVTDLKHDDGLTTGPTLQSVYDSIYGDQSDAVDYIFGSIASDDFELVDANTLMPGGMTLGDAFDSLSDLQKDVVFFIASGIEPEVEHSDTEVDEFLAHFGVKGMRWGFSKSSPTSSSSSSSRLSKSSGNTAAARKAARAKVKSNTATLGEAHLAAVKSKGHRTANALLGDKTYWKRAAILAGVTSVGVGIAFAAPALLPAGALSSVGIHALGAGFAGGKGAVTVAGYTIATKATAIAAGKAFITKGVLTATGIVSNVGGTANVTTNTTRSLFGNKRVNDSYQKIGENLNQHQTVGASKVAKTLKLNGGVNIRHEDSTLGLFLDQYKDFSVQHASAEVVNVKPASDIADKTKGTGNGKFDESKVKRDQGGKFSTKEERRKLREKLDDGWAKRLDDLHGEILGKHTGEFKKMMADVAKKHDIDIHEINGNKAAKKEYEASTISMLNEFAKKDGVSPSGNKRVEFTMGSNGQPKPHVVSHEGPNPNHEDTRSFIDSTIKSRQARSTIGAESTANTSRVSSVTADQNKHAWWKFHHDDMDMVGSFVSLFDDVSLQHAAAAVAGGSSDSKGDGKGGSKFDESKVKRDGGGKFSKIAAKRREDRQDMKDELDKGWLDNLDWHRQSLVDKHMEELTQMAKDIAEKHGIKDYHKSGPATKAANQEFTKELIPRLNKWAAEEGVNISPSGNKRMEFRPPPNTGKPQPPKVVVTDYHGPNPNASATKQYINDSFSIRRVSRAADREAKAEGPGYHSTMFNPDAKLDTSRVHDASDSAETGDTSGQRHWWEFWHSDTNIVEEFLAHHGIKGMKWGVRRSDSQLSRAGGRGPKDNSTGKERTEGGRGDRAGSSMRTGLGSFGRRSERKSDFGDVPGGRSGGGYARGGGKKKGDDDNRLSADAERSLKTSQKKSHEMSDREMKEAIGRANQIKQYNQLFGTGPKSDLENAVAQLQLQKQYKDLQAQLNPPKVAAVKKFASGAAKGFAAYQQVDQAFGGQLTSTMSRQLGLQKPMSPLDKIKLDNDFLAATKSNITLKADVNELSALKSSILNGDSPSKAVGYLGAGKRRAVGSHKPIF